MCMSSHVRFQQKPDSLHASGAATLGGFELSDVGAENQIQPSGCALYTYSHRTISPAPQDSLLARPSAGPQFHSVVWALRTQASTASPAWTAVGICLGF